MEYNYLLVRFGEITLKTGNRKLFISALKNNIIDSLSDLNTRIISDYSALLIELNGENYEDVIERLRFISGIFSVSPVVMVDRELSTVQETALELAKSFDADSTFKIEVKRKDKKYPYDTNAIQREVGGYVLTNTTHLTVDVKTPDYTIMVYVKEKHILIYTDVIYLTGGLPYGTGGESLLLLSGGIDSPVAGLEVAKKGVEIVGLHFHSPPYTSKEATEKVKSLTDIMSKKVGKKITTILFPFTEIQTTIYKNVPDNLSMTVTRRLMLTIAERIAKERGIKAIVTGENLGQVASQTLSSMHVINEVTSYPVLRPLLTLEKLEIIELAHKYGTYDTSILPFEDCCTIFKPKSPAINPKLDKTKHFEGKVDFEPLIEEALKNIEIYSPSDNNESFDEIF